MPRMSVEALKELMPSLISSFGGPALRENISLTQVWGHEAAVHYTSPCDPHTKGST